MYCIVLFSTRKSKNGTKYHFIEINNRKKKKKILSLLKCNVLTCKNETGSFSLRASIQNCNRDVVFCSLHVQLVTCSFNDRCLVSLSCLTASISHCLRLSMDRINASHLASTCLSNSSHSPYNKANPEWNNKGVRSISIPKSMNHNICSSHFRQIGSV